MSKAQHTTVMPKPTTPRLQHGLELGDSTLSDQYSVDSYDLYCVTERRTSIYVTHHMECVEDNHQHYLQEFTKSTDRTKNVEHENDAPRTSDIAYRSSSNGANNRLSAL